MFTLGITGGIGSGKSEATRFLANRGAVVFDADLEAKKYLLNTSSLQQRLIHELGPEITNLDGSLDLGRLAAVAFTNDQKQNILNQIIWPEIRQLIAHRINLSSQQGESLFIVDAALLIEADYIELFDAVLLVICDDKLKIQRALERGNLSLDQIQKRLRLQLTDHEKIPMATHVIENNGSFQQFHHALDMLYHSIT